MAVAAAVAATSPTSPERDIVAAAAATINAVAATGAINSLEQISSRSSRALRSSRARIRTASLAARYPPARLIARISHDAKWLRLMNGPYGCAPGSNGVQCQKIVRGAVA